MNRIISRGSLLAFTMLFAVPVYSSYFDSSHSNQAIKNKGHFPTAQRVMNNLMRLDVEFDPINNRSDYQERINAITTSPTQELYQNISDRQADAQKKFEKIRTQINEEDKAKLEANFEANKKALGCLIETSIAKSDSNTEIVYWCRVNQSMRCIENILGIKPKKILKPVMEVKAIDDSSSAASSGASDKSEA